MSQSHEDSTHGEHDGDQGGTVSEAGSSPLGSETSLGGADSVPDTPDVNDPLEGGGTDLNESSQEGDA